MSDSSVYGLIGLTEESVGLDRRIYTGLTSTDPTLAVSYNSGRVDVFLNGVKLVGNHSEMPSGTKDYTFTATGQGSSITLATGVALVSSDVVEVMGYVSNSANTVTTYNYTASDGDTQFTANNSTGDLVNVYLNGVLLDSSDYNLTTANTVTLGSGAAASDIVHIQVIGALDNSNFVPAGGGTFSGNVSFGDNNITNVGDIAVDTISSDAGTSIGVTLGTDAGDDFNVGSGKLVVEGDTGDVGLGTAEPEELLHLNGTEPVIKLTDSATSGAGFIDFDGSGLQLNTNRNPNTGTSTNTSKTNASIQLFGLDGDANIRFYTTTTNNSASTERMRILSGGDVEVKTGNLKIGSAGQGIDFSATGDGSGASSVGEVFDDYETGQFTVSFNNAQTGFTTGYYRKVGDVVFVTAYLRCTGSGASGTTFSGLPFNCATAEGKQGGGVVQYHNFDTSYTFKVDAIYNTDDFRIVYNGNSVGQIQAGTEMYVAFFYFVD